MVIEKIKQDSIAETLEKFKPYENLIITKGLTVPTNTYLLDYLNSFQTTIDEIVKDFNDDAIIDLQDLEDEIKAKRKEIRAGKDFFTESFIINGINHDAGSGSTIKMYKDYSALCLFFHFNSEYLISLRKQDPTEEKPITPEIVKSNGTKFSLKEIAYLHFYNGEQITKENNNEVAKKYGWGSGHKLIQHYSDAIKIKRLDTNDLSYQQLKNKIDLIKSIIDYVKPEKQKMINDELRKLETDLEDKRDY